MKTKLQGCSPTERRRARTPKSAGPIGTVYIIHFTPPYKHAQHYTGWTADLVERVERHQLGRGANLVRVALAAGCQIHVATTFAGTRALERTIKRNRTVACHCPLCNFRPKNHGRKGA